MDFKYALAILAAVLVFVLIFWWRRRSLSPAPEHPFDKIETQMAEIEDGLQIRYHQSGRGPHLLLVHGLGANLFCWRYVLPLLTKRFTVTALDLPGFGQSSKPAHAHYGLDDQAERVARFLKRLNIKQTFIVGNSMGGNISLWLALRYPDLVRGIALIAPASSAWLVRVPVERLAFLAKPASLFLTRAAMRWAHGRTVSRAIVDDDRVDETFRTYRGQSPAVRSFLLATSAIRDPRLLSSLKTFTRPILILWGSRDRLVSRKVIDELQSALPQAESHVHIGGGHHLQEDEPDWVSDKVSAFFKT